jgi:hypothetical protein
MNMQFILLLGGFCTRFSGKKLMLKVQHFVKFAS